MNLQVPFPLRGGPITVQFHESLLPVCVCLQLYTKHQTIQFIVFHLLKLEFCVLDNNKLDQYFLSTFVHTQKWLENGVVNKTHKKQQIIVGPIFIVYVRSQKWLENDSTIQKTTKRWTNITSFHIHVSNLNVKHEKYA